MRYPRYELIVVDDGSTDDTEDVVSGFGNTNLYYYKKENAERAAARNYGAKRAKGDYITFLDSDDILFPDALEKAAAAIKEKDNPCFLHLSYEIGTASCVSKTITGISDNDPMVLVEGNPLSCMGIFLKKEVFDHHGFNEDRELSASEDWEFWIRLAANYGLRTDNRIVGRLIEHEQRSVVNVPKDRLVKRKELAVRYAFEDPAVRRVFGHVKNSIEAYWNTYIALHLAMDGHRKDAFDYLCRGAKKDLSCLFTRRAAVILKFLVTGIDKTKRGH
jgi:glycosyltransferase involved in cell wall biosynthesis